MKKASGKRPVGIMICLLAVLLLSATGAWPNPTTPEQAKTVVANWLAQEAQPMGCPLGGQIRQVQTFNDRTGNPAYYVVFLNPSGLVFLPADDLVEPIIAFVDGATSYGPSPTNRLWRLINGDIPGRVQQARQLEAQRLATRAPLAAASAPATAQKKWARLAAAGPEMAPVPQAGALMVTKIDPVQSGPGDLTVTLTGVNFTGVTSVTCFPAVNITWTVASDTQIIIQGNFPNGFYSFTVTGPSGSDTSPTMTVGVAPLINSISPGISHPGPIHVILTGKNFSTVIQYICSDSTLALTWNVVSDTQITVDGTFAVGTYTFTVQNAFGASTSPTLTVGLFGYSSPSDVRVAPFIHTSWGWTTVGGSQTMPQGPYSWPCYNYFTPPYPAGSDYSFLNYPTGTTATAELMRFWQYPTMGVGRGMFTITVNGGQSCWTLRGGDGLGGPYQWANMPLDPLAVFDPLNPHASEAQRQAIGNLCHDIDLSVNMDYEWSSYVPTTGYTGTNKYNMSDVAKALVATFKYSNAKAGGNAGNNIPCTNRDAMINPNLDAGYPVVLSVTSTGGGDFLPAVCDGYGYNLNSMYHHLHMGYDGWFNLPLVWLSTTDQKYQFNILTDIIYNVYVTGSGEIISGRVLDTNGNPVGGAKVTATRSGGGVYAATTKANGIYAIVKVPSSSTYSVIPTFPGLSFVSRSVTTGVSSSNTINTGNVWGVDFVPNASLNRALDNYALSFSTGGNANWFEESTTFYYGGSAAQSGAIANGQSTNLTTTVTGPGTLSFYWKVSSYLYLNSLIVSLDGTPLDAISGGVDWTQKTLSIPSGLHTITWQYHKTTSQTSPLFTDQAWVDKVVYAPGGGSKPMTGILNLLMAH